MKTALFLMCLVFTTSVLATPIDVPIYYDSQSGYYRKCEVMPYPDTVNVVPEPSTLLMFGLAGLFMGILIVLKRKEI